MNIDFMASKYDEEMRAATEADRDTAAAEMALAAYYAGKPFTVAPVLHVRRWASSRDESGQ